MGHEIEGRFWRTWVTAVVRRPEGPPRRGNRAAGCCPIALGGEFYALGRTNSAEIADKL